MTQLAGSTRTSQFTAAGLHDDVRALHRQGLRFGNAGWICVGAALGLSLLGVAAIGTTEPAYAAKHLIHLGMGLVAAAIAAMPNTRWLQRFSYPFLGLSLLLLVLY